MEYAALSEAYARAETTMKRLELAQIAAGLLEDTPLELVPVVVHLTQGRLAPPFEGIELGISDKLAIDAIAGVAGATEKQVVEARNRLGDLGSAAEQLMGKKTQATLFSTGLDVKSVHEDLLAIAKATGSGSQERKLRILRRLLSEAEPLDARYLVRTVTGKLRLGVQDATVLDALAALITSGEVKSVAAMEPDERSRWEHAKQMLERANDVSSDLGLVAATALRPVKEAEKRLQDKGLEQTNAEAIEALGNVRMRPGTPLRPMLAERSSSLTEILERTGGRAALEYKYDGLRVQAHLTKQGEAWIYSRRLEDLTAQFPDVVAALQEAFVGHDVIVEGEAVAIDAETGRLRPFQVISHRRGRKYGIQERREASASEAFGLETTGAARGAAALEDYPIATYLFDLLYLDEEQLLDLDYETRRDRLDDTGKATRRVEAAIHTWAERPEEIEAFMQKALADGAEGIMAKNPESRYKAGSREWSWIKYKADYVEGLADTLDLAVIGAFHGQGRRAGVYGTYLLASWDPDATRWVTVCRVATGFDDKTLAELMQTLEQKALPEPPKNTFHRLTETPDVWFDPFLVMEVSGAEFTLSPVHTACWGQVRPDSGIAVRFPRFTGKLRDDKDPTETTTPSEILQMYDQQVKIKGSA